MAAGAGQQLFLGIQLDLDSSGVVRGARIADAELDKLRAKAKQGAKDFDNEAKILQQKIQGAAAGAALGIAGIGAGQVLRNEVLNPMIDEAAAFEVEFSQLKFVTGAVGEELQRLRDTVIETGLATQFSPQEATLGLRRLKAAGLDTDTALKELNTTLDLATASAGELGLGVAAETTAAALKKFGDNARDGRQIMDTFVESTRQTNFQMRDLPIFLRSIGSGIQKLNAAPPVIFAIGGALRNVGLTAADAGNAVQGLARKFAIIEKALDRQGRIEARTGGRTRRLVRQSVLAFRELGVEIFDQTGKFRGAQAVIGEFSDAINNVTSDQKRAVLVQSLFGQQAGNVLQAIGDMNKKAMEGAPSFNDLIATLEKAGEAGTATREAASAFEDTLTGLDVFIEGTKQTIQIVLGETLLPIMKQIGAVSRVVLGAFLELVSANPALARAITITTGALSIFLLVGGLVLTTLSGIAVASLTLGPALATVGGPLAVMSIGFVALQGAIVSVLPFIAGFVGLFLGIIAVVALVNKVIQTDFLEIATVFRRLFGNIRLVVEGFVTFFSGGMFKGAAAVKLATELQRRDLMGFVITLLQWKERAARVIEGFVIEIKAILMPLGIVLLVLGQIVFKTAAFLADLFTGVSTENVKDDLDFWRRFGTVLARVAAFAIPPLIARLVMLTTQLVITSVRGLGVALFNTVLWTAKLILLTVRGVAGLVVGLIRMNFVLITKTVPAFIRVVFMVALTIVKYTALAVLLTGTVVLALAGAVAGILASGAAWVVANAPMLIAIAGYTLLAVIVVGLGLLFAALILKIGEWAGVVDNSTTDALGFFSDFWELVAIGFDDMIQKAINWGSDLMTSFLEGMKAKWEGTKEWFGARMQDLRDLMPGSDAKVGPLSTLTEAGSGLFRTFQVGLDQSFPGFLESLRTNAGSIASVLGLPGAPVEGPLDSDTGAPLAPAAAAAAAVAPAAPAAAGLAGRNITISFGDLTVNVAQASDEEAANFVETIMQKIRDAVDAETEVTFA